LINATYNNLEIVVVNDGSTDNTDFLVRDFIDHEFKTISTSKTITYIHKSNGGKGSALNAGIKNSNGDIIVTMDADTIFENDAIFNAVKYFYKTDLDAAVGNVKIANSRSLIGIIQQIEYTVGFYFKRTHSVFNSEYIIGGAFGIFRRNVFDKYGYFDEQIKTEDIELSTRLQSHGCKILYIENAIAYTEGPAAIRDLMKQRLRWKKGRLDTFLKHRDLFFSAKNQHSKFLTFYLLPITLFYEFELLFEPILTFFGVYYLLTTGNYLPILIWIAFTGFIYVFTFLFGSKKNSKLAFVFLPTYFFLSYVLTFVEVYAMYSSIRLLLKREDVVWQNWQRKGLQNV
jgi:cellulose synthase/poly-beta-1,6-N-acetylglucosamine synthase-like glycosyltransferase